MTSITHAMAGAAAVNILIKTRILPFEFTEPLLFLAEVIVFVVSIISFYLPIKGI